MLTKNALEYAHSYNDRAIAPLLDYINQALAVKVKQDASRIEGTVKAEENA